MTDLSSYLTEILAFTDLEDAYYMDGNIICVSDNNVRAAGLIARKLNNSNVFDTQLVRLGKRGDSIILGFDTMTEAASIYTALIGPDYSTTVEVKRDTKNRCLLYVGGRRYARTFPSLAATKRYIDQLDQQLNNQLVVEADEDYEYEE